ncbi:MAG: hypothetical protein C0434_12575 [Xanthomonadaceae bacterium]|nr:hypothetical protein [Xanthomonadaceae bacterium]
MARSDAAEALIAECSARSLRAMANAALDIIGQTQRWADSGRSALQMTIGHVAPIAWQHHPDGDARDRNSGYRWYYHCHGATQRAGEHGHFHLFSEHQRSTREAPTLTHLVAIGIDARGLPTRAFTVNRWVTDEVWRDAPQVLRRLARFRVDLDGEHGDVSRWLSALTVLFGPQLKQVVIDRDAAMNRRAQGGGRPNLRDDRRLEVISQLGLSLARQINAIDARLDTLRKRSLRMPPAMLAYQEDTLR